MTEKYTIDNLTGHFGYTSKGEGVVVFLYTNELDNDAIEQFADEVYGYDPDGDSDWAVYDPSNLQTKSIGTITDDNFFYDIIELIEDEDMSEVDRFVSFIENEIIKRGIPLIYINTLDRKITQIEGSELVHKVISKDQPDVGLFIREYDN